MQSGSLAGQGGLVKKLVSTAHGVAASANGSAELADTRIGTKSKPADGLNIRNGGAVIATSVEIPTQGSMAYALKTVNIGHRFFNYDFYTAPTSNLPRPQRGNVGSTWPSR